MSKLKRREQNKSSVKTLLNCQKILFSFVFLFFVTLVGPGSSSVCIKFQNKEQILELKT